MEASFRGHEDSINAGSNDPRIGVHMLSEFMFCPRAGLIAYELQQEEELAEPEQRSLTFFPSLPKWQVRAMKSVVAAETPCFLWALALAVVCAAIAKVTLESAFPIAVALIVLAIVCVGLAFEYGRRLLFLLGEINNATSAEPSEPSETDANRQSVNWWSLLNAGFESINYKDKLVDEQWQIAGKPWRVLRRGDLRIPVFRLRRPINRLHDQHDVRMVAYCHLLQVCEGAKSPYGIILFANSFDGICIANNDENAATFHAGLKQARQIVTMSQKQQDAEDPAIEPERYMICRGCHCGFPKRFIAGQSDSLRYGERLRARLKLASDGQQYHSQCGDRFDWTPPHESARERGLT